MDTIHDWDEEKMGPEEEKEFFAPKQDFEVSEGLEFEKDLIDLEEYEANKVDLKN